MSTVTDTTSAKKDKPFICGVCEGFYGKPWTTEQRQELFMRMNRMGMNTYLYAPKDDYKHRLHWRDLYSGEEAEELQKIIEAARDNNVTFVYALSPGLDITYSNQNDLQRIKDKLDQLVSFNCEAFSLLFDDVEPEMVEDDTKIFPTVAHAQSMVTNAIYTHLNKPDVFLFCPTEYCTTRASPDVPMSEYLAVLGDELAQGIDILWTGPKVVSRKITCTDISDVTKKIRRRPVIWDNIHANDYDQTRVYLGPYDGRSQQLRLLLKGVLTNPNCEFEANFVAMHTLAQWSVNKCENYPPRNTEGKASAMDTDNSSVTPYKPKLALQNAIVDWLPEFYKTKKSVEKLSIKKPSLQDNAMDTTQPPKSSKPIKPTSSQCSKTNNAKIKEKRNMDDLERLTINDLLLICDLFYLPYEYGPRAVHLLKTSHWLITNITLIADAQNIPKEKHSRDIKEWYERAIHFHQCHKDLCLVVDKFVNIPNRPLLYDLYAYIGDMRSGLTLVNSYIKWNGMGKPDKEPFKKGEQEPWVHRGGIYSEFKRLLPIEGQADMYPPLNKLSAGNSTYTIRPYWPEDKEDVYKVCLISYDDGQDGADSFPLHPQLPADACIGCFLEYYQRYCYVLEDDAGICGYVCCAPSVVEFRVKLCDNWLPMMCEKYPQPSTSGNKSGDESFSMSGEIMTAFHQKVGELPPILPELFPGLLVIQILNSRVKGINTASLLMAAPLKGLKATGVEGVHTHVRHDQIYQQTLLQKLGFVELKDSHGHVLLYGKPL